MRCLLKFNTTPASSHLSGTDSYLITISPFRRGGKEKEYREESDRGRSERVELLVWSGTTRIVAAHHRARTRELSLLLSLSRQAFFSSVSSREDLPRFSKILSIN